MATSVYLIIPLSCYRLLHDQFESLHAGTIVMNLTSFTSIPTYVRNEIVVSYDQDLPTGMPTLWQKCQITDL